MTKLLINEHPLMLLPTLAKAIGLNESIILQQLHYWLNPKINNNKKEGRYWVFNSYNSWKEQFPFWSETTIKRTILSLEKQLLIVSKNFNNSSFNKTKWYSIDYKKLSELERIDQIDSINTNHKNFDTIDIHDRLDQNDPWNRSKRPDEETKMIRSINTETTTETTTDISLREKDLDALILEWNKNIPSIGYDISLTKKRKQKLTNAFINIFKKDMDLWKKYLSIIVESNFLMGNITNFKINFDWAISEENILKVLEGAYSEKEKNKELKCTYKDKSEDIRCYIDAIKNDLWKELSKFLLKEWGEDIFFSWFMKLQFDVLEDRTLYLRADNGFIKKYIETYYVPKIVKIIKLNFGDLLDKIHIHANDS